MTTVLSRNVRAGVSKPFSMWATKYILHILGALKIRFISEGQCIPSAPIAPTLRHSVGAMALASKQECRLAARMVGARDSPCGSGTGIGGEAGGRTWVGFGFGH